MSLSSPTPPLLLTKRLTAFLHTNLNSQVHTALLTTPAGKLLAHASTLPVSTLRTQCTVAASLWATYAAPETTGSIAEALPPHAAESVPREPAPGALTLQLSGALVVLRRLKCGLLFVCIGPTPEAAAGSSAFGDGGHSTAGYNSRQQHSQQQQQSQQSQHGRLLGTPYPSEHPTPTIGSPSEVASVASAAPSTTTLGSVGATGVVMMRRHAEELAKWLDDKLGTLGVPTEGATFES